MPAHVAPPSLGGTLGNPARRRHGCGDAKLVGMFLSGAAFIHVFLEADRR